MVSTAAVSRAAGSRASAASSSIQFSTAGATIRVEDANASEAQLRVGQVVLVQGSISSDGRAGTARSVSYFDDAPMTADAFFASAANRIVKARGDGRTESANSSLELSRHWCRQVRASGVLRNAAIDADPLGLDAELILGTFDAGAAFAASAGRRAYLARLELTWSS